MTFYWLQLKQYRQFLRGLPGALSTDPIVLKGLPGAQGAPTKIALMYWLASRSRQNEEKLIKT